MVLEGDNDIEPDVATSDMVTWVAVAVSLDAEACPGVAEDVKSLCEVLFDCIRIEVHSMERLLRVSENAPPELALNPYLEGFSIVKNVEI